MVKTGAAVVVAALVMVCADAWGAWEYYDNPPCNPGQTLYIMDSDGAEFCSPKCNSKHECPKARQGDTLCKYGQCFNTCNSTLDCPSFSVCHDDLTLKPAKACMFPKRWGASDDIADKALV